MTRRKWQRTSNVWLSRKQLRHNTLWEHIFFQNLAGFQMILKSGRVLERNQITMECERYCISSKPNGNETRGASTEYPYSAE